MKNADTAEVERDFPGWTVWLSQRGECWVAVQQGTKPELAATVIADSEEELRAALVTRPAGVGRLM